MCVNKEAMDIITKGKGDMNGTSFDESLRRSSHKRRCDTKTYN